MEGSGRSKVVGLIPLSLGHDWYLIDWHTSQIHNDHFS